MAESERNVMINYSFLIADELHALKKGEITSKEWCEAGQPCIKVGYDTQIRSGEFTVSFWDLVSSDDVVNAGTERISIEDWSELDLLKRFEELLQIENYVENRFLSQITDDMDDQTPEAIIKAAMERVDYDDSAAKMCELLTDLNWSTYKMFEDLCSNYLKGNEDVRKGIRTAFSLMTGYGFITVAKDLLKNTENRVA